MEVRVQDDNKKKTIIKIKKTKPYIQKYWSGLQSNYHDLSPFE